MSSPEAHSSRHPTFKQYVVVAIFLFAITLVEFLIIVPENFRGAGWTLAPLVILSVVKFAVVILFYMHLKFDNRMLTWIFLGGLFLGLSVTMALVGLFGTFTPSPRAWAQANAVAYEHEAEAGAEHVETPPATESTVSESGVTEPETAAATTPPASSGPATTPAAGDPARGKEVFLGTGICFTCHIIEDVSAIAIGPELTHIGTDAATRKPGMSAAEYIDESIRTPEVFIAEGVERALPGLMTTAITASLSDDDITDLVAFLLEQK